MTEAKSYTLQIAKGNDLGSIVDYYRSSDRPETVFQRKPEVIEKAISQELFLLLTDQDYNIAAAAGVYTTDATVSIGEGQNTRIDFAEIGSLWRRNDAPKGFIRELFYSAAVLQTLRQAPEQGLQVLTTQIVAADKKAAQTITGLGLGLIPFKPSIDFSNAFKQSIVDDRSRKIDLLSYIATVHPAAINSSKCLLGLNNSKMRPVSNLPGCVVATDFTTKSTTIIDLNDTQILQTAEIVYKADKKAGSLPYNSWAFAGREILPPIKHPVGSFPAALLKLHFGA